MIALPLVIAGGLLYTGLKIVQQLKQKKESGDEPAIGLMNKADRIFQRFMQQKVDPLLTGSSRQTQLAKLKGNNTALPAPGGQEQKVNRLIALSGVTMGLAAIGKYLFPPLLILTAVSGIYLMLPLYQKTFKHLKEGKVKADLLASLYLLGFWFAGYYIFAGFTHLLYFTGVKVISQMEGRSRENLTNLFGQQPRFVWQLVDGIEVQTPLAALHAGDVVVVNAGEPLPVDGVVIKGLGSVDQHMLTGESQPVDKEAGEPVFTSTLLLSGRLFIRVEKTGENTLTAKISEILSQTVKYQAEAELKGQQLADKTVLPNLAASLLALVVVGPAGSVAVLGAGLGINMRLVSLLGIMNYLTIASRHKILVKDGRALERLKDVDTIVFDKTGTLTLEQPHLDQIHVVQAGLSEADLLGCAATAEYRQPHPIAKAIIHAAEEQGLKLPEIEEANYEVGYGIKVRVRERLIRVGSSRFITREGLTIPSRIETLQAASQVQGFALVLVAVDEQVAGALELHATIRPEAGQMIQDLHKRNLSITILSGDQEQPTKKLAAELGIDNYYADTLPENKADIIKQLQAEGRVVCFIGDGINDAIALKQADVSISLLGATAIATDTAQIVLMDRSLKQLGYLLALSDKFDKTLQAGFLTTLVPGCICIGGVFVAGFGIISAEILFQLGFFSGLAVAMRPLFTEG
ncbi:MAG: heavy metal translocating P-type ATPase, partial [Gammaproteobacteria bacterium]|nr:heavy metal translocating P-type ATPase [Gammaproteobacteria bacterium]